jgi:hypothetical protein
MEHFIERRNIARYKDLLKAGNRSSQAGGSAQSIGRGSGQGTLNPRVIGDSKVVADASNPGGSRVSHRSGEGQIAH